MAAILCSKCGVVHEGTKKGSRTCKACNAKYMRAYRLANPDKFKELRKRWHYSKRQNAEWVDQQRARGRKYWADLRHEAVMAYGGYKCSCECGCTITEPMFLELDHIHNDGAEHRRSIGYDGNGKGASSATLRWLQKNGYPPGFQVLCANCNKGKERNKGRCPLAK